MLKSLLRRITSVILLVAFGMASSAYLSATDDSPSQIVQSTNATPRTDDITAAQPTASTEKLPPPVAALYIGTNQCFQCHRPQTNTWSETKHAHAFTDMPPKYQSDPDCLKCHVTGFGETEGYIAGTEKDLSMVGCEACHGPGAGHVDAAKRFVLATPDEEAKIEKEMRDTIIKNPTDSVCIACHLTQAHQSHPAYEGRLFEQVASGSGLQCNPVEQCLTLIPAPACYSSRYNIKTCGSCHYGEYKQWRTEKHSALSAMLPTQHWNDPDCQKCHPKADAVVKSLIASDDLHANQIGVVCESCHGPALKHVRFNRLLISSSPLGRKMEQAARHSIGNTKPATSCIQCHISESHQQHPLFGKK